MEDTFDYCKDLQTPSELVARNWPKVTRHSVQVRQPGSLVPFTVTKPVAIQEFSIAVDPRGTKHVFGRSEDETMISESSLPHSE